MPVLVAVRSNLIRQMVDVISKEMLDPRYVFWRQPRRSIKGRVFRGFLQVANSMTHGDRLPAQRGGNLGDSLYSEARRDQKMTFTRLRHSVMTSIQLEAGDIVTVFSENACGVLDHFELVVHNVVDVFNNCDLCVKRDSYGRNRVV